MIVIWIGALLIGVTLGLLGSGGSAITVPLLIYLVGHGAKESIAESMAIVGLISVVAAIPYAKAKQIDWRSVWFFGVPGMFGTFIGAWLGGIAAEALQLIVFGAVLMAAAYLMFPERRSTGTANEGIDGQHIPLHRSPIWKIAIEGMIVGIVTGFVGVGGGFLIVPALVVLGGLPLRLAIRTSLVIIALNAAIGFAKYEHYLIHHDMAVNVQAIAMFVLIGIVGSMIGKSINTRLNQRTLKTVFSVFLVVLGGFVIVHEGTKLITAAREPIQAESSQAEFLQIEAPNPVSDVLLAIHREGK